MKAHLLLTTVAILGSPLAAAQNVPGEPTSDPVLDAIQEFKKRDRETTEIVAAEAVPLTPPPAAEEPAPAASPEPSAAVLVTGKSPEASEPPPVSEEAVAAIEEPPSKSTDGLTVRVEKLNTGNGIVDPSKVKLLAPYPAKPLAQAPAGWKLDTSDSAPPFTREVELSPGSKITLTIRPHVLIPDADGAGVFTISEPGFDPSLGYQQTSTVGSILATSIRQLDEDSKQLSNAIDNLQQLLVSLPSPEPAPPTEPAKPAIPRKK
jgi:hypothetical protein